jgi:Big-like domain-containing protein
MRRSRRRKAGCTPRGLVGALTVAIVGTLLIAGATPASAFPTMLSPNGQMDFTYGSAVSSAGGSGGTVYKPESKLFYTGDGTLEPIRWWAVLGTSGPSPAAGVWLYESVNHNWVARVQLPDADPWAKADALFESGTLYVSTRDDLATSGNNQRQSSLYKIPYNGGGTWGAVQGPFTITTGSLETLTLARDSSNRLWVTYESGGQIKVGYTAPGGTSFTTITVSQTNVKADDISAVTAFGGDRIGVFWSDQNTRKDFFAWRSDSASVSAAWHIETAYGGGVGNCPTATSDLCGDDHMNVKVYQDEVYVSIKSSLNDASSSNPNDPLNLLLRRSSGGTWSAFPVSTVSQNVTRPITLLSPTLDKIWVWGTRGSEVDVWESSFTSPGFTSNAFIPWTKGSNVSPADPTSTKQVTTAASGAFVMSSASGKTQYWHNEFLPSSAPANTAPVAQNVTTTATSGVAKTITLTATDAETCELTFNRPAATLPSGATVSAPTNASCTGTGPYQDSATVTYTAPIAFSGPDSFTYTVHDGALGSNTATVSITVSPPPPNTPPSAQDVTTTATAGVAKTITLTGTDPETCQLSFDRPDTTLGSGATVNGLANDPCTGTGPFQDTAKVTYTAPAGFSGSDSFTYTVHDGTAGSNTATVSITVSPLPPNTIVFRSASTGANNVGTSVVIPAPAGVQANDVMVAVLDVKVTPTVTAPAGWALVSSTPNGSNFTQKVYSKVAGSEPASYTWTSNENRAISGAIVAYSGVNTATPVEIFSAGTGTTASITAPSVNSAFNGAMVIGAFGINADSTIAPPAGMTERGEIVSATRIRTEVSDVVLSSAGSTGAKVATAATAAANVGQLIVLRPA